VTKISIFSSFVPACSLKLKTLQSIPKQPVFGLLIIVMIVKDSVLSTTSEISANRKEKMYLAHQEFILVQ